MKVLKKSGLFVIVLISVFFSSCKLDEVSREERIEMFLDDLNVGATQRTNVYKNFHDDCGDKYVTINVTDYWDINLPAADNPYSVTISGTVNNGNGTYTVSGTLHSGSPNIAITFVMKEEDENKWYILELHCGGINIT